MSSRWRCSIGMISGVYSSIFIATPLLAVLKIEVASPPSRRQRLVGDDLRAAVMGAGVTGRIPEDTPTRRGTGPMRSRRRPTARGGHRRCAGCLGGDGSRRRPTACCRIRLGRARRSVADRGRGSGHRRVRPGGGNLRPWQATSTADRRGDSSRACASFVREIRDYPTDGVTFRDITPLLGDATPFSCCGRTGWSPSSRVRRSTGWWASRPAASSSASAVAYRIGAGLVPGAQAGQAAVGGGA